MSKASKCHIIHQPTHLSYPSSRCATASATRLMMRSMASHVPHYPQKARNPMSKALSASKNPLVCTSQLHIIWMCYNFRHATCDGDGGCLASITLSSDWVSVAAVWWHLQTLDLMRSSIIITSFPAFNCNASLISYSCTHPKQFPFAKESWCSSTPIEDHILLPASPHHRLVNILTVCSININPLSTEESCPPTSTDNILISTDYKFFHTWNTPLPGAWCISPQEIKTNRSSACSK